jgi:hypothetical protein
MDSYDDEDEATHIFAGDPALAGQWQVNVSDTQTRTMTGLEIAAEFAQGALDPNDVFVWREGMAAWVALGKCPELMPVLTPPAPRISAPPAPIRAPQPGAPVSSLPQPQRPSAPMPGAVPSPFAGTRRATLIGRPGPTPGPGVAPPATPVTTAAAGPRQSVVPFAAPAALSAGQSPLRGPTPSNPAMQSGAFGAVRPDELSISQLGAQNFGPPHTAPATVMPSLAPATNMSAAAQAMAAAQLPGERTSGAKLGLIVGGALVLLVAVVGTGFFLLRSPEPQAQAPGVSAKVVGSEAQDPAEDATTANEAVDGGTATADGNKANAPKPTGTGAAPTPGPANAGDAPAGSADKSAKDPKDAAKDDKKESGDGGSDLPAFNVAAAVSALNGAASAASGCGRAGGPSGRGKVTVTFAPSGKAVSASVDPPFAGTPVGSCAVAAFRGAKVPAFAGSTQSVTKSFFVK